MLCIWIFNRNESKILKSIKFYIIICVNNAISLILFKIGYSDILTESTSASEHGCKDNQEMNIIKTS